MPSRIGLTRENLKPGWLIWVLVLGSLLGACGSGSEVESSGFDGVTLEEPRPKPNFVLTDTEGHSFDFVKDTDGRLTFLYFGYTNCPDICPVHLSQLESVFEVLPEVRRAAVVVFVTVDPGRDSAARIREFLDQFNTDFVGLTGTQEQLEEAQRLAGVAIAVKEGEGADYSVGHAGQVLVYAPDGLGYTMYPFGTRQSEWIHDLPILLEFGS